MAERMNDGRDVVSATDEHTAERPLPARIGFVTRRGARRDATPHSFKFRAATGMLVGLAVAAIVVAVALLSNGSSTGPPAPWSSWSPPDNGTLGARDIADHIAPFYRISGVDQLAVVTVINLANPNNVNSTTGVTSGLQVAVRPDPSSSAVSVLTGSTIAYNLCGIGGSNCAIGIGSPSNARLLLLRREALELALLTFKYISGVANVVAILPPGHTTVGCTGICPKPNTQPKTTPLDIAVLFAQDELQPWLSQPLSDTLPEQFPPTVAEMPSAPEAALVDQITARALFSERLVQAQDGSNLIVLDPMPPQ